MRILDIHVHHRWFGTDKPRPDYLIDQLKSLATHGGIEKVLLLTLAIRQSPENLRLRNDAAIRLVRENPNFFLGACYLTPGSYSGTFLELLLVQPVLY